MLQCPKCQNDNDLGRIFCAKCGEKLDITHVGPPSGVSRKGGKRKKALPLEKILKDVAGKFVKVIFLASFAALVTLIWLPPDVQRIKFDGKNIAAYDDKLELLSSGAGDQSADVTFEEPEVNAKMAQAVQKTMKAAGESNGLALDNVYFNFQDGFVVVTAEKRWKWFRLTTQLEAKANETTDGKWELVPSAARVGRFQLAPQLGGKKSDDAILTKFWDLSFKVVLAGADKEKQILDAVSKMVIQTGKIILTPKKGA